MSKSAAFAAFGLCLLLGTPARAELVDATDEKALARAMQDMGWKAKLGKGSDSDPVIASRASRSDFEVYFYSCKAHTKCSSITLSAGYNMKVKPFPIEKINDWNARKRFGTASLDKDGDPHLSLSVNLFGGVSRENLEDTLDYWRESITDFEKTIEW